MSADQELASTGASGIIPLIGAALLMIGGGVALVWKRIATRSAQHASK